MNRDRLIKWISFAVFVLAGTGTYVAGYMSMNISWLDWRLAENIGKTSAGLNQVMTISLIIAFSLGFLALAGGIVCVVRYYRSKVYTLEGDEWIALPEGICWFDKVFGEVQVVIGILASCLFAPAFNVTENWFFHSEWVMKDIILKGSSEAELTIEDIRAQFDAYDSAQQFLTPNFVSLIVSMLFIAVALALDLLVLISFARKISNRCFWRNTIIGLIITSLVSLAEKDDKIYRKVFIIVIAGAILSMTWVGAAAVIVLAIIFLPRYLDQFKAIREGAGEIRSGNLDYEIPASGQGELARLAEDINEISQAQQAAITKELKTQRLRTDLITNVSHDLKTPLTSIVTYVDLLDKEGLDSENAPEYLEILGEKTERLRKLSEDLFEAAKASSGDIPVNAERIDALAMVNQALAELEEGIRESGIEIIVTNRTEDTYVMADGRHLWRVFENLIVNMSKYAMPGTRGYIDISEEGEFLKVEVKNMSREQLNIDPEELMERFQRGDESRTTEGSGLGLAIARDLTSVMGGRLHLTIDGDLFKVTVELPRE